MYRLNWSAGAAFSSFHSSANAIGRTQLLALPFPATPVAVARTP
jgi:hypothetical protein